MGKLFFASTIFLLTFALAFASDSGVAMCFEPLARISLNSTSINMLNLHSASSAVVMAGDYYYFESSDGGLVCLYMNSNNSTIIEFGFNSSKQISNALSEISDKELLFTSSPASINLNLQYISGEKCRPISFPKAIIPAANEIQEQDNVLGSVENEAADAHANGGAPDATSGAGTTAKRADSSAAQMPSGFMEDASSFGEEAGYNAPQTPEIANSQVSPSEQKGSITIEGWIFPATLGAISTLFLAIIMAYFFRSRYGGGAQAQAEQFQLGQTQMAILDEISQSDKIPTDISLRIGKSKSTVVEHLDNLCKAGLVEKISSPEKKFVFYRLSQQGRLFLLKKRQAA